MELTNTTRQAVNLDGWTLEDASGHAYTFDGYRLAGRATVRIHTGQGYDTRTDLYQGRRAYVWNNDRDTATLSNARGRVIDEESWGPRRHGGHHCPAHRAAADRRGRAPAARISPLRGEAPRPLFAGPPGQGRPAPYAAASSPLGAGPLPVNAVVPKFTVLPENVARVKVTVPLVDVAPSKDCAAGEYCAGEVEGGVDPGGAGVGGVGELEVGAQDVDAGLAEAVVGGVVGEADQGVDAAEPDGGGVGAEFVDGLGEAFGVQSGGVAVGAGLVDALAAVGDDQGDERACPGDHSEGEFHQVEQCLRVELGGAVDALDVQQDDQAVEDAARGQDRGGEGDREGSADLEGSSAAAGNVRPVATPGTHSRRTGRKPKYVQYEDFRPARREHAPDAAP